MGQSSSEKRIIKFFILKSFFCLFLFSCQCHALNLSSIFETNSSHPSDSVISDKKRQLSFERLKTIQTNLIFFSDPEKTFSSILEDLNNIDFIQFQQLPRNLIDFFFEATFVYVTTIPSTSSINSILMDIFKKSVSFSSDAEAFGKTTKELYYSLLLFSMHPSEKIQNFYREILSETSEKTITFLRKNLILRDSLPKNRVEYKKEDSLKKLLIESLNSIKSSKKSTHKLSKKSLALWEDILKTPHFYASYFRSPYFVNKIFINSFKDKDLPSICNFFMTSVSINIFLLNEETFQVIMDLTQIEKTPSQKKKSRRISNFETFSVKNQYKKRVDKFFESLPEFQNMHRSDHNIVAQKLTLKIYYEFILNTDLYDAFKIQQTPLHYRVNKSIFAKKYPSQTGIPYAPSIAKLTTLNDPFKNLPPYRETGPHFEDSPRPDSLPPDSLPPDSPRPDSPRPDFPPPDSPFTKNSEDNSSTRENPEVPTNDTPSIVFINSIFDMNLTEDKYKSLNIGSFERSRFVELNFLFHEMQSPAKTIELDYSIKRALLSSLFNSVLKHQNDTQALKILTITFINFINNVPLTNTEQKQFFLSFQILGTTLISGNKALFIKNILLHFSEKYPGVYELEETDESTESTEEIKNPVIIEVIEEDDSEEESEEESETEEENEEEEDKKRDKKKKGWKKLKQSSKKSFQRMHSGTKKVTHSIASGASWMVTKTASAGHTTVSKINETSSHLKDKFLRKKPIDKTNLSLIKQLKNILEIDKNQPDFFSERKNILLYLFQEWNTTHYEHFLSPTIFFESNILQVLLKASVKQQDFNGDTFEEIVENIENKNDPDLKKFLQKIFYLFSKESHCFYKLNESALNNLIILLKLDQTITSAKKTHIGEKIQSIRQINTIDVVEMIKKSINKVAIEEGTHRFREETVKRFEFLLQSSNSTQHFLENTVFPSIQFKKGNDPSDSLEQSIFGEILERQT